MGKNGYFQISTKPNGVYLKLFPEQDGGEPISIKELTGYLQSNGFSGFDLPALGKAVNDKVITDIRISEPVSFFVNETMSLHPSRDGMELTCRFYPASEGGSKLTEESILLDLGYKKIAHGIDVEAIRQFLKEREYCKDYVIARGTKMRMGCDAKIEYFFNTNLSMKPKVREDGSVDFHDLSLVSPVEEGSHLAHLTPADPGDPGIDIYGATVKPPTVKSLKLKFGKNIQLSEDGNDIYSKVTGHASLVGGQVFVSDVYEVAANVDNSTGDINYDGNVHVKGDVKTGFSISASGNVVVDGSVEGANIHSGGQVIIRDGIHGMGKAQIIAKGSVSCKFIENATVISEEGSVSADIVMHSKISAVDQVMIKGKRGMVTGGQIRAGSQVEAAYIGSEMGAQTEIEVGADPAKMQRHQNLQKQIRELGEEIEKTKPILDTFTQKLRSGGHLEPKKQIYLAQLINQFKSQQAKLTELTTEDNELMGKMKDPKKARVVVTRTAYAGVTIKIGSVSTTLKSKRDYCQYIYEGGEVVAKVL